MPFGSGETEFVGTDTMWHVEKFEQTGIYVDRQIGRLTDAIDNLVLAKILF
jgi:hypothetical protein